MHMAKRKEFPLSVVEARLEFAGWQCEHVFTDGEMAGTRCLVRAEPGRFHADHDLPDRMGGKNNFANCRILCLAHHAEKTAREASTFAKMRDQERKHGPMRQATKPKSPLAGRTRQEKEEARRAKAAGRIPVPRNPGLYRHEEVNDEP